MEFAEGVDDLFEREYAPLVRSLSVAFDPESAADAVQEAFIAADRRWSGGYDDPAAWVRRAAVNRLLNGRRNSRRRGEIVAAIRVVPDDDLTIESNLHDARLKLRSPSLRRQVTRRTS
jgi:DNA-directed RNA polymerase specialized sigma24 family protein